MKVITYRVTLLEPVLVTSLQGDPNSAVAFDYLPGSVLRGMVIGKYLGPKVADTSDGMLQRLFFDGTTRYLNGYPLDVYDQPGLPVPASWRRVKHDEREIFDFAVEAQKGKEQWQPVPAPFYTQSDEDVRLIQPARNVAVHTQRTARFGRAMPRYRPARNGQAAAKVRELLTEDEIVGAVYRYDALAAGQSFQAAIICDYDADASTLFPFIRDHVSLGGSRSGGYGQAEISKVQVYDHDLEWHALDDSEDVPEGMLIVTLRSDVLLRDERGQFTVDPELVGRVLSRHLQVELKLEDAFLNSQLVGGFNRRWRLPLPQALAMRMGSVLIFQDPGCDPTALAALEVRGIGERRAEGFGRIVFNRQRVAELTVSKNTRSARDSTLFTISEEPARNLAERMVGRMLKQRLDEGLLAAANTTEIVNPPSNAQLSRLRGVVLETLYSTKMDTSKICQFIESIENRSSARRQFERSTINTTKKIPLLRWLKYWLQSDRQGKWMMGDKDQEWKDLLHLNGNKGGIRIDSLGIGDVGANIDDDLRLEYMLRLLDLVLARAAKERGKEN